MIEKGIVRLPPGIERAEQLLGEDDAIGAADLIERTKGKNINYEFAFVGEVGDRPSKPKAKTRKGGAGWLAMRPQRRSKERQRWIALPDFCSSIAICNALRTMLKFEIGRGADFTRLANALSALYPKESAEKRLLDAMLLAAPQ